MTQSQSQQTRFKVFGGDDIPMSSTPCHVLIPLGKTTLVLTTTAAHALEILAGATIFPTEAVTVVDVDGEPFTKLSLERVRDADAGVRLNVLTAESRPKAKVRQTKAV